MMRMKALLSRKAATTAHLEKQFGGRARISELDRADRLAFLGRNASGDSSLGDEVVEDLLLRALWQRTLDLRHHPSTVGDVDRLPQLHPLEVMAESVLELPFADLHAVIVATWPHCAQPLASC